MKGVYTGSIGSGRIRNLWKIIIVLTRLQKSGNLSKEQAHYVAYKYLAPHMNLNSYNEHDSER